MRTLKTLALATALALASGAPHLVVATVTGTTTRNAYTGNGSTTVFSFTFRADDSTWVKVYLADVLQSSGYTVVRNANQVTSPGGTVTFSVAPAAGVAVKLQREAPLTQTTSLTPYSAFPSKTMESSMDRLAMQAQQIDRDRADLATKEAADVAAESATRASGDSTLQSQVNNIVLGNPNASLVPVTASGGSTKTLGAWMAPLDATGTPSATTYLRGDKTWATPAGNSIKDAATSAGVDPTGVADSTAGLQAVINSLTSGGTVFMAAGTYLISAPLTLPATVSLLGVGGDVARGPGNYSGTIIYRPGANSTMVSVTGNGASITGIAFRGDPGTVPASGYAIDVSAAVGQALFGITIRQVAWRYVYGGLRLAANAANSMIAASTVDQVRADDAMVHVALEGNGGNLNGDNWVHGVSGGNTTTGWINLGTGVRIYGGVEGMSVEDIDLVQMLNGLVVDGPSYVTHSVPAWIMVRHAWFDSSFGDGVLLNKIMNATFVDLNAQTNGGYGVLVSSSDTLRFVGCNFTNNIKAGVRFATGSKRFIITAAAVTANNRALAGYSGIEVAPGVSDFLVNGNVMTNSNDVGAARLPGVQSYGMKIEAGASDRYQVANNLASGNAIGGVLDGGTGVNKFVGNNY